MTDSTVKTETITYFSRYTPRTNRAGTKYYTDGADNIVAKQCTKCKEIKEGTAYTKCKNRLGVTRSVCKQCARKYQVENKEQIAEKMRKYRTENKEQISEKKRKYYSENKKQIKEKTKKYYSENKERAAESRRKWYKANPDKVALMGNRRRARKKALPDTLTPLDLQLFDSVGCYLLPESESLHLEHFIPLSWGIGGTTFENCYYMDGSLNISKGNRNPFVWIETQPVEIQHNFYNSLVPELAARNGMTVEQYTLYVYECEEQFLVETSEAVTFI